MKKILSDRNTTPGEIYSINNHRLIISAYVRVKVSWKVSLSDKSGNKHYWVFITKMGTRSSVRNRQGKPGGNTPPAMAPRRGENPSLSKNQSIERDRGTR